MKFTRIKPVFVLLALVAYISLTNTSCTTDELTAETPFLIALTADSLSILSLEASRTTIKAWDTTAVAVRTTGKNLQYQWSSDEGTIVKAGADSVINFTACETCVGTRVITCRVSNEFGFVVDTIHVNVTSYFK